MKTHCRLLFFLSVFLLQTAISYAQTYTVAGIVVDDKGAPMMSVNIYIRETLEGTSSREDGSFDFKTTAKGEITLCAQMLGYTPAYMKGEASGMGRVHLVLHPQNVALQEVFVTAGNYRLQGSSKWKEMSPVSIATTAGAVGDIYNGIALLPGVQAAGESGKLMVRGGDSREAQTFIDEMHVLSPYTYTPENSAARGRYSPFLFDGRLLFRLFPTFVQRTPSNHKRRKSGYQNRRQPVIRRYGWRGHQSMGKLVALLQRRLPEHRTIQ